MESWILTVAGRLLRLPPRAVCTACTYLQHYQQQKRHPETHITAAAEPNAKMLVAACLLVASKVEEAAVSNNHLLNLVSMLHELLMVHNVPPSHILGAQHARLAEAASQGRCKEGAGADTVSAGADPCRGYSAAAAAAAAAPPPPPTSSCAHIQQGICRAEDLEDGTSSQQQPRQHQFEQQQKQQQQQNRPEQADAPSSDLQNALSRCEVLVGDAYYAAKSQLLLAEQVVLRLLRFRLPTPHPTAALLHIAAVLRVPAAVASASLRLLHDATTFSTVLLPLPPSPSCSGRLAKQSSGLANTSRHTHVGLDPGTSSRQSSKQDVQQVVSRRVLGGGERDISDCGWGVVAEKDELEGRTLLAALMAEDDRSRPSLGLEGAGHSAQTQRGPYTQLSMGSHTQLHLGSMLSQAQDSQAVGQQTQLGGTGSNGSWAATAVEQRGEACTYDRAASPAAGTHK